MRALVVYESMFGNTEQIAKAIGEGLSESMDVQVQDVRTAPRLTDDAAELVVVGGPTHAFSLSRPATRAEAIDKGATGGSRDIGLREWLGGLGRGTHSQVVAAFDTRSDRVRHLPGSAARKAARLLRHDNFASVGEESFYVGDISGPLLPGELDRARAWGRQLATSVSVGSVKLRRQHHG